MFGKVIGDYETAIYHHARPFSTCAGERANDSLAFGLTPCMHTCQSGRQLAATRHALQTLQRSNSLDHKAIMTAEVYWPALPTA